MEIPTTTTEKTPTKAFQSIRSHPTGIEKKAGDRESQTNPLAISAFYSSKTGLSRGTFNSGSFTTEYVHKLPIIQNANHTRDQVSAPTRILDHLSRSQGRLLARSDSTKQKTLSGVQIQRSELAVSSNAIWPERCPTHIHQSDVTCHKGTRQGRHLVPALPRRPAIHRFDKRRMPLDFSKSTRNHQQLGLTHKRKEISTHTSSEVRMVGHTMGSNLIHRPSGRKKIPVSSRRPEINHHFPVLYQENSNESSRPVQLDRPKRPHYPSSHVHNKNYPEIPLKNASRCTNKNSEELENASLRLGLVESIPATSGITSTRSDYTNRRVSERLGFPDKSDLLQRHVRPINDILYQRQGTADHLVRTHDYLAEECHNSGTLRQFVSSTRIKKRRFHDIPSVLSCGVDMEESSNLQLDTQSIPHSRDIQRHRRPTVQEYYPIHRMVSLRSRLSESPQTESTLTSGPICDEPEQQTSSFRVSLSRPGSSSSECTNNVVGQVESSLPLPTDTSPFEGFMPDDPDLLRYRSAYHTGNTHETLVHGPSVTESPLNTHRSQTSTSSCGEDSDSAPHYKASRVAVIRTSYQSQINCEQRTIGLLATPIRETSLRDYEIKWGKFCAFLTERKIPPSQLSLTHVLDFFSYLFFEINLRPNTIAHYRSALSVPLQLKFQINLYDPAVYHLIRAMKIQRPNAPATAPAWSLNKVLQLLDNWPNKIPLDNLLQKNAFLLLLATGWRISELHACVRMQEFCSINIDNSLKIRPHPSFLAKNECPQNRWPHRTILALRLSDGTISKLCPVNSLTEYLSKTS